VLGACCLLDCYNHAFCSVIPSSVCTGSQGTYQGDNTACTAATCPQPQIGACCYAASATRGTHCAISLQATCTTAGGTFGGNAVTCQAAACPAGCPCDWDHDGYVTGNDLVQFSTDWLAGHGDFNHDGVTDALDYTEFASCYQSTTTAGCIHH
jgi:hypothetical protein